MTLAPSGTLTEPFGPDGHDPVVGHDDVALGDDLVAPHRDDLGTAEHDRAARAVPRPLDHDGDLLGLGLLCLLLGLGLLLVLVLLVVFALERSEDDRIERQAEEARADGPGDRLAAVGPGGVVGADVGELLERNGRLVDRDLGRLAAEPGQGQQVELVGDAGQRPSAVGPEQDLLGRLGLARRIAGLAGDAQMRAAVGAVESHRDQALGRGHVDPVGIVGEVRPAGAAGGADERGVAAVGGNPDEVEAGVGRVQRALDALAPRCAQGHDPLAVGRPDRVAVERGEPA